MTPKSELEALAIDVEKAGIIAAKQAGSTQPWYHGARADLAHAANCFAVAAALRAIVQGDDNE